MGLLRRSSPQDHCQAATKAQLQAFFCVLGSCSSIRRLLQLQLPVVLTSNAACQVSGCPLQAWYRHTYIRQRLPH